MNVLPAIAAAAHESQMFVKSDMPWTLFHPGCTVTMHSLQSVGGKAVNGKKGVVGAFDYDSGRWVVNVEGKASKYRPENMVFHTSAGGFSAVLAMAITPDHQDWKDELKNTVSAGFLRGGNAFGDDAFCRDRPSIVVRLIPEEFRAWPQHGPAEVPQAMQALGLRTDAAYNILDGLILQLFGAPPIGNGGGPRVLPRIA